MDRILTYSITKDHSGTQILDFLRAKGFSRNILSSMKSQKDAILLNGLKVGGRTLLSDGDILRIHIPETGVSGKHPSNLHKSGYSFRRSGYPGCKQTCRNAGTSFYGQLRKYPCKRRRLLFPAAGKFLPFPLYQPAGS